MKRKIILTGATGLFGSNIIRNLKNKNILILWGHKKKTKIKGHEIHKIDLTKYSEIERKLKKIKPKAIIHSAALTNVDLCEQEVIKAYNLNSKATENLAILCKKFKIKMIYLSSDQIYNGKKRAYKEDDKISPINIYGITKFLGESYIRSNLKNFLIIRTNFFGFGTKLRKSLSDFILDNLKKRRKIYMYTDVFFNPLYVSTLIEYIFKLESLNLTGIFNLTSDQKITKYRFAVKIAKKFNLEKKLIIPSKISTKENKVKRPSNMFLTNKKLKKTLKIANININDEISKLKGDDEY
jgi:dTDP-4-dehydrorhamnose reductase